MIIGLEGPMKMCRRGRIFMRSTLESAGNHGGEKLWVLCVLSESGISLAARERILSNFKAATDLALSEENRMAAGQSPWF
jgi:hypothetical protein